MDPIHRRALTQCRSRLVSDLSPDNEFWDKVAEKEIFTPLMLEMIQARSPRPEKVRQLLNDLLRRGPYAYGKFLDCLDTSGHGHLADVIRAKETSLRSPNSNLSDVREPMFTEPIGGYTPNHLTESSNYGDRLLHQSASAGHLSHHNPPHVLTSHSSPNIAASGSIVTSPSDESSNNSQNNDTMDNDVNMANVTDNMNTMSQASAGHDNVPVPETEQKHSYNSERSKCYKMTSSPKGFVLIINNQYFQNGQHRRGAERDGAMLKELFTELGFEVDLKENKTAQEMLDILRDFSKYDRLHLVDSLIVVLMSHGNNDYVEGIDSNKIKTIDLVKLFDRDNCPHMVSKPKMFVINACRGDEEDSYVRLGQTLPCTDKISTDSRPESFNRQLPANSDLVLAYSTFPGYVSYRDEEDGSWFIQSLVDVFREKASEEHVMDMLTLVNSKVAEITEDKLGLSQTPAPTTTLRYKWYLNQPRR